MMLARQKNVGSPDSGWPQNRSVLRTKNSGFGLVEILISITLGLFVLSGVISVFASTIRSSSDGLKTVYLNQQLRVVMDVMTHDLRRAEFWGTALNALGPTTPNDNPFALDVPSAFPGSGANPTPESANSCLTYSYDANSNGVADAAEAYGFRLRAAGVQGRQNGAACTAVNNWEYLTDERVVAITDLQFTVIASPVTLSPALPGTLWVRDVRIRLTGQLTDDPTVRRTLTETIRVRNDRYTP